jgi:L,D-peptidoglycan transpeptidase YkuD (ErfK/YbiS/YcfS/YnhG family)
MIACACSSRRGAPAPAPAIADARTDAAAPPAADVRIPDSTRQLVTVVSAGWDATTAELKLFTRDERGAWRAADAPLPPTWAGTLGRTGLAWGRGLHGEGAPAGRTGPLKQEGDGKSPAGLFAIGPAFGYTPSPPPGTRIPYTAVDEHWRCVDDPSSAVYNRVLDERTVELDWSSAEDMRRADDLYTWVLEVRHNAAATPRGGSCIFFHVWGGPDDTTVGCTAMPAPTLASLIATLDPAANPVVVQLPAAEYAALAPTWGLPAP